MEEAEVVSIESVGPETVALEFETPAGFEGAPGQFILVRADIDGAEQTGYYTLSSADVAESFEVTVAVDPDGDLGPWLAERSVGDVVVFDGPFGDIRYTGKETPVVVSQGPGVGPAVGIAERALMAGRTATIVHVGDTPPHRGRLDTLEEAGVDIHYVGDPDQIGTLFGDIGYDRVYVFGFTGFVNRVRDVLSEVGIDDRNVSVESFGPE